MLELARDPPGEPLNLSCDVGVGERGGRVEAWLQAPLGRVRQRWERFVSEAYWNVKLEE